ncbi:hypothetical protein K438DRAFT_1974926 [Mycena galopus ATCC 62051]|nr:hypothetical protein K438DRAFT_1974926 [Mycena galopus ATCC 62051]
MSQNPKILISGAASKTPAETAYAEHLKRKASRQSSARYRLRNRDALLESERLRAARRRADLKTTKKDLDIARQKAREASARYRERNRETLALKQRERRSRRYQAKHGYRKFLERALQAGASLRVGRG